MMEIVFEPHAITYDNEKQIASGHYDVDLSPAGVEKAKQLGQRRKDEHFDAIFTSDLQRAYKTAELAFGEKFPVIRDRRLRECDYGDFEHKPKATIRAERIKRIDEPFPNGESYGQCAENMKSFLQELLEDYDGKRVLIIGHRATHHGLDRWILGRPLEQVVTEQWEWQPGWTYQFKKIQL
jgi:broad specificity phosphatase PhoE